MNTERLTLAISQLAQEGATHGEIAVLLISIAHAVLGAPDSPQPELADVRLMYLAGRVSGMANENHSH